MIKRAVIGHLIQWSSHSWYDILFHRNYAAPTAPHVFIASSTHVKLKSSLCTWYSIIARRAQWENVKATDPPYLPRWSARRHHRALMRAQRPQQEFEYWAGIETFPSSSAFGWHYPCPCEGIWYAWRHVHLCSNSSKKVGNCVKYKIFSCLAGKAALIKKNMSMTVQILETCSFFLPKQEHSLTHTCLIGQ